MKETIGERISVVRERQFLEVLISGKGKVWQESVLFAWVLMWTLIGIYIISYMFMVDMTGEQRIFFLGYLVFWGYFEYTWGRAWFWKKFGVERIRISDGHLEIKNDVRGYGKVKRYFLENIHDLGVINQNEKSFSAVYFRSFWTVGGETVGFEYMGQKVILGRQLPAEEARRVASLIRKYLKRK
ncbi:hypothetical protein KFE98_12305 [bacterium SCSIO 12741]|nr:hypothetical protein KFE98_12305 [bacterium SCSIO 12741]